MSDHGPVEEQFTQGMLRDLGNLLAEYFAGFRTDDGRPYGFALLFFPLGEKPTSTSEDRTNYLSNAQRPDMLAAMKEFIARAEGAYFRGARRQQ